MNIQQQNAKLSPDAIRRLAKAIDHTALKADTTKRDIEQLCVEAIHFDTASVCVNPSWITLCKSLLKDTSVMPITVVGFPLGATTTGSKVYEAREAIYNGAKEIDMVLNVGLVKGGAMELALKDIYEVLRACEDVPLKVIFETCYLTAEEIFHVAHWCAKHQVAFVKTSTGFGARGASVQDIEIMKRAIASVSESITEIKASGGIRTLKDAEMMIAAGATRLGASATRAIMMEAQGLSAVSSHSGY
jgi:deoxyribose-phosphate aldolase